MPPIAIYEDRERRVPDNSNEFLGGKEDLCRLAVNLFNKELGAPDYDKEIRVIEVKNEISSDTGAKIRISCTVGDNEYPDNLDPSFRPSDDAINDVGIKIIDAVKGSGVSEVIIETWSDTTYKPYDQKLIEKLNESDELPNFSLDNFVEDPVIKIIVPVSANKVADDDIEHFKNDLEANFRINLTETTVGSGIFNGTTIIIDVAETSEVDFSVEFDGKIKNEQYKIPENIRDYMANSILHNINKIKPDCSGEVWIRQGVPNTKTFLAEE